MAEPPEELWEEILLRLPPDDPASLLRASLVCKLWRRIFSSPGFLRRLGQIHGATPMLGFFHNYMDEDDGSVGVPFVPIAASAFSIAVPEQPFWVVVDCRHGRVLLRRHHKPKFLVWEPSTGDQRLVADVPADFVGRRSNAAVMCAADGCDHRSCQGGPFRVVLVYALDDGEYVNDYYRKAFASARVYSSESGAWGEYTTVQFYGPHIDPNKRSVLAGSSLYFQFEPEALCAMETTEILRYDLREHTLSTTEVDNVGCCLFELVQVEDGGLGFVVIDAAFDLVSLMLFSWDEAASAWVQKRTIRLEHVLPHAAVPPPAIAGFAEGADTVLLTTGDGIYAVELKAGQARKVSSSMNLTCPLFPFISQDQYVQAKQKDDEKCSSYYHEPDVIIARIQQLEEEREQSKKEQELILRRQDALEQQVSAQQSQLEEEREQFKKEHELILRRQGALEQQVAAQQSQIASFASFFQMHNSTQQQVPFAPLFPFQPLPFLQATPFAPVDQQQAVGSTIPSQNAQVENKAIESPPQHHWGPIRR